MKTLREKFAAALLARGEQQVPSKSGKFLTFTRHGQSGGRGFYFIGKSGSLRYGPSSSKSFACSDGFKNALLTTPVPPAAPKEKAGG